MGHESSSPAEESAGAGGAIIEVASQRVTRLGGVLARRWPPTASPSSRRMPEPNTAIGTAMAPVSMNFGPQNCGAVAQTLLTSGVERRVITDYCDFTTGSAFSGDRSATDARRAGHRKMARLRWAFTIHKLTNTLAGANAVLDRLQREPMPARDARARSARSVMRCALPFRMPRRPR